MDPALIILDLDETLIHASESPLEIDHDFYAGSYLVHKRPHLEHFLREMQSVFQLAVWTSASQAFADKVVSEIFESPQQLKFIWSADRCTQKYSYITQEHFSLKKLSKVKRLGCDLERTLMIDDTPQKLSQNYGNYIRVKPFYGSPADDELLRLAAYLGSIADEPNMRSLEKRGWRDALN